MSILERERCRISDTKCQYDICHMLYALFHVILSLYIPCPLCNMQDITQLRAEFPPNTWMDLLLPPGDQLDQEMKHYLNWMRVSHQRTLLHCCQHEYEIQMTNINAINDGFGSSCFLLPTF